MTAENQALTFTKVLKVSPTDVYTAFTNTTALREWLSDGAAGPLQRGESYFVWWNNGYYAAGDVKELIKNQLVSLSWYGRHSPASTQVKVTFEAQEDGTLVTLKHSGFGAGSAWEQTREESRTGWERSLENLRSVLETGIDLRVSKRPMLGIIVGDILDEQRSSELGLPVSYGMQIADVIDDMGAQASGLQAGDVIVQLGETPINDFGSVGTAISNYQAGEVIDVIYYHGEEKHKVPMTLSTRPLPHVPDDVVELSEAVAEIYDRLYADFSEVLADVTDEEASFSPAEGEWDVKNVLAHLILSERGTLFWLATLISGNEIQDFPGNVISHHNGVIAVYPTVQDLMAELRRTWDEMLTVIATLPEEFVARKGSYVRLGIGLLQSAFHPKSHYEQIRNAIKAAREQ